MGAVAHGFQLLQPGEGPPAPLQQQAAPPDPLKTVKRAAQHVRNGHLKRGSRSLMNGELADVSDPQVQSHAAFLHPADAGGPIPDLPADSPSCNFLREEKHCDRFQYLEGVKLLMSLTERLPNRDVSDGIRDSSWQGNSS